MTCPTCKGSGQTTVEMPAQINVITGIPSDETVTITIKCTTCNGTGSIPDDNNK